MKYVRLVGLAGLLIGLMVVSVDCASVTKPIETEADFIGFITEIHPIKEGGISGQISVESHADKIVARYTVTIEDDTLIFRQDGDKLRNATFAALETRQWVQIWFSGPVMESWPMQGTAQQVVIIE
ncbi:MAG: DUF3221 domain-containing protein [Dehalococcoidales bacterium]|nr:DUF3221 domain-containing protein [Dehalococcoidales bacterium]